MKILYLYSELSPYLRPVFELYVKKYGAYLHVVHWDHNRLTPYLPVPMEGVIYYNRSEFNLKKLNKLSEEISPDLIYIVGWMDIDYLRVVRVWRKLGVPVVVGFDDIWRGTLRQKMGALLIKCIGRLFFSHAFVSFNRQYEFAKRLGFKDESIVFNLLSCDRSYFQGAKFRLQEKGNNYPRRFVYVGRFSREKGIDILVEGFKLYRDCYSGSWDLLCVGIGDLVHLLQNVEGLEFRGFVGQDDLALIFENSGALVLPSYSDVSPLVVHEATTSCLPLILSSGVGNKSTFLIDGFNGFSFRSGSVRELALAMKKMSSLADLELIEMSKRSEVLSMRVSPEMSAASLMSII
jgi:glycosyltransferase involved in cell wall biosynthesis